MTLQSDELPQEMPISSSFFPEDMMINLLQRLPVKSLFRFMAVCKSWRDLISSPYFNEAHLHHSRTNEKLLRVCLNSATYKPEINLLNLCDDRGGEVASDGESLSGNVLPPLNLRRLHHVVIEGSCNGLVCLRTYPIHRIFLCNPATRQFRQLKHPFVDCCPIVGICFVAKDKDYRMVRIQTLFSQMLSSGKHSVPVYIYSLNDDSWKKLDVDFPYLTLKSVPPTLFNECMHWIADEGDGKIVAFDVKNEIFQYLSLPVTKDLDREFTRQLAIVNGSLSVILRIRNEKYNLAFEVWKMNEYGNEGSWSKLFFITESFGNNLAYPMAVGSWKDGKILFRYYSGTDQEVLSYDPFTKEIERFFKSGFLDLGIINYVETMESVEGGVRRNSQNRIAVEHTRATSSVGCSSSHGSDSGNLSMGDSKSTVQE